MGGRKRKREDSKYVVFFRDDTSPSDYRMTGFKTFEKAEEFYIKESKTFNNEAEIEHEQNCDACGGNSSESEDTYCEGADLLKKVDLNEDNSYKFNLFPFSQSRVLEATSNDYQSFSILEIFI